MTSKAFPKTRQYKGLPFTKMIVTVIVISLLPIVLCTDIGVREVLSNSTVPRDRHKFPQSLSNNTLHIFKRPDGSDTELLGRKDSRNNNSKVEYLVVQDVSQNATEVSEEDSGADGDLLGDLMTQNVTPGDGTSGLEWLQNVYNPHLWGPSPPGELGTTCGTDMKIYLAALNNGTVWAAKSK
jgi:hypothetical protein